MKRGLLMLSLSLFILGILVSILVLADDNSANAYTCLLNKFGTNCGNTNNAPVDQIAFSLAAAAYDSGKQSDCKTALMSKSSNNECWPSGSCALRDTSISTLALNRVQADTSKPEAWLLRQNMTSSDLTWYIEIDSNVDNSTRCTIKYDDSNTTQNSVVMKADKSLSLSGGGNCLALANSNYWLKISQSCIGRAFRVSCDSNFQTALLYKKTGSDIWYISSQTNSASAGGETSNSAVSKCFEQNNVCSYEGSLWAAIALQKNNDISAYLPYLIALSSDNENLNPYAFLYLLTGSDEYSNDVRNAKKDSNGLWTLSSYGKYYDSALAFLA
jgi:hypothetical protein